MLRREKCQMSDSPVNFNGLDSTVHGPVRLGVLTSLQIDGALDFTTLKKRLGVAETSRLSQASSFAFGPKRPSAKGAGSKVGS